MGKLFGTDGVRGVYGEYPLLPDFVMRLGQAAGILLREKQANPVIVIGRDTRSSGEIIQNALVTGFMASGVDVLDAGVITTPGIAWLTKHLNLSEGVVISASHNPYQQNGIKFFSRDGEKLEDTEEEKIEELVLSDKQFRVAIYNGKLTISHHFQKEYLSSLIKEHKQLKLNNYKIVLDCANGAASAYASELFSAFGSNIFTINASPNGQNINKEAGSEYVRRYNNGIGNIINITKANFGIAFDGDSDRVIFVDECGNIVDGDAIIGLLAIHLKKQDRLLANTVAVTVMRNLGLKQFLLNNGIEVLETPVGDKYIYNVLKSIKQKHNNDGKIGLGGEQSGHIILLDESHNTGDGMRTALFVMEAFISSGKQKFSEFVTDLNRTPQIIASAYVGNGKRISKEELELLTNQIKANHRGLQEINLRYSGTEPLFRAMLQSDGSMSEKDLASLAVGICNKVQQVSGTVGTEIDVLNCTKGGIL